MPLDEYKANLAAMVQKLRKSGISNIIIITPPPVHEAVRAKKVRCAPAALDRATTRQLHAAADAAAAYVCFCRILAGRRARQDARHHQAVR